MCVTIEIVCNTLMIFLIYLCTCVHVSDIRHLQAVSAVEQETKYDMETLNNDIRRQLAKMTSKCRK